MDSNKQRCCNYCGLLDGNGTVSNCVEKWYNSGSIFNFNNAKNNNNNNNNNYNNNYKQH